MGRPKESFQRRKPRYKPQPSVLVICEDAKSSREYLQEASQHFRANLRIQVEHCGNTDPKGIVAAALKQVNTFDRILCVIDRDSHANFDEALRDADSSQKIDTIVSYPCFEYWLLIHFIDSRKPYMRTGNHSAGDLLLRDLCMHPGMDDYAKGSIKGLFTTLLGAPFEAARRRSPKLLADAIRVNDMNPSTELHLLMDLMENLGSPQLV